MANFTVKAESLPERCEICHQTDMFDPATGYCARCSFVPIPMPAPTLGEDRTQPFMTPQPFAPPQPYSPPPFGHPLPGHFAQPPVPQPFPYRPPVSPLAPIPPHVVHEPINLRHPEPRQRLYYRFIGSPTVSEWIGFRNALFGSLAGVIPFLIVGLWFLNGSTPWLCFAFILEGLLAGGFAGFQVGQHIHRTTVPTLAREFRQTGLLSAAMATFPIMLVPFIAWYLAEMKKNAKNPIEVAILVLLFLVPYVFGVFILNLFSGYLAARAVEKAEGASLVPTYRV